MGKVLMVVLVAFGVGLLVYWLASPHAQVPAKAPQQPRSAPRPVSDTAFPPTVEPRGNQIPDSTAPRPIAPPRTEAQKESDATEARRAEFYDSLRRDAGNAFVMVRPAEDDAATLDIKAEEDNAGTIRELLNLVFSKNAYYYGFRHVRFYAPNPPQMVDRYRLAAEANADSQGNWQTFLK